MIEELELCRRYHRPDNRKIFCRTVGCSGDAIEWRREREPSGKRSVLKNVATTVAATRWGRMASSTKCPESISTSLTIQSFPIAASPIQSTKSDASAASPFARTIDSGLSSSSSYRFASYVTAELSPRNDASDESRSNRYANVSRYITGLRMSASWFHPMSASKMAIACSTRKSNAQAVHTNSSSSGTWRIPKR